MDIYDILLGDNDYAVKALFNNSIINPVPVATKLSELIDKLLTLEHFSEKYIESICNIHTGRLNFLSGKKTLQKMLKKLMPYDYLVNL